MTRLPRWEIGIVTALVAASVLLAWLLVRWTPAGLSGRYWINPEWAGPPAEVVERAHPSIDEPRLRLAGEQGPFSAEWEGYLVIEESGTYEISLISDDGSWIEVDGVTVIDNGGRHGTREVKAAVPLRAGARHVRIRYFDAGGDAFFRLDWQPPGQARGALTFFDFAPERAGALRHLRAGRLNRALSIALPVFWALLFLYIPTRILISLTRSQIARVGARREDRRAVGLVLAAGVVLTAWGIGYGIGQPWVPDALVPGPVRAAYQSGFSNGWFDKYPTAYFAMLSIPMAAFEIAGHLAILPVEGPVSEAVQEFMFQLVSLFSAVGTLSVAYLCGAEMYGPRRGVAAPVVLLLTPLFVYYGKTANLDMPAVMWFGWAVLGFIRVVRRGRTGDYVLLGAAAAAAVATKDQYYANLALLPLGVLFVNARRQPAATWPARIKRALIDRRLWLGAATAAGVALVLYNVLLNFSGFVAHFRELASYGHILPFAPATAGGYLWLTVRTGELFAFGMGWAWAGVALAGILLAAGRPPDRWWLWLLLVPLSFHLAFTLVTRSVYDRYLFGGVFVLALFGGRALSALLEARRSRLVPALAAALLLGYSTLYSASVNVMMTRDSRYETLRWVRERTGSSTTIGWLGSTAYMPYFREAIRGVSVRAIPDALTRARPDLLIVNARMTSRYERDERGRELLRRLDDGSLGYREVFRYRSPMPAWALLQYTGAFTRRQESDLTNLDKMNPEMVIYERAPAASSWSPSARSPRHHARHRSSGTDGTRTHS